jgi:hypothetical protein
MRECSPVHRDRVIARGGSKWCLTPRPDAPVRSAHRRCQTPLRLRGTASSRLRRNGQSPWDGVGSNARPPRRRRRILAASLRPSPRSSRHGRDRRGERYVVAEG